MWNVMKAQNYQLRNSLSIVVVSIICLVFSMLGQLTAESGLDDLTGSVLMINNIGFMFMVFLIFSIVIVPLIMVGDRKDKTMNYELLSGHSREQVFFGRVLLSIFWGVIGGVLLTLGPIMIASLVNGWGSNLIFKDAMYQYFLIVMVYFRLICELVLLSMIVKQAVAAGAIMMALFDGGMIIAMILGEVLEVVNIKHLLCSTNMLMLCEFDNSKNEVINGEMVTLFTSTVSKEAQTNSIIISLVVGFICILLGYKLFKKEDLR